MNGVLLMIVALALVMAATLAIALIVLRRVGDSAERRADELRAEVAHLGEEWVIPLAGAVCQGGGDAASRGRGVLGLTGRRVLFLPISGRQLSVPRVRVVGARVEERRRDAGAAHRHRLVLALDDGTELTFLVDDRESWVNALGVAAGPKDAANKCC